MAFPAQLVYLKETWKPARAAIVNAVTPTKQPFDDAQAVGPIERGRESHNEVAPTISYYAERGMWASISLLPPKPVD